MRAVWAGTLSAKRVRGGPASLAVTLCMLQHCARTVWSVRHAQDMRMLRTTRSCTCHSLKVEDLL